MSASEVAVSYLGRYTSARPLPFYNDTSTTLQTDGRTICHGNSARCAVTNIEPLERFITHIQNAFSTYSCDVEVQYILEVQWQTGHEGVYTKGECNVCHRKCIQRNTCRKRKPRYWSTFDLKRYTARLVSELLRRVQTSKHNHNSRFVDVKNINLRIKTLKNMFFSLNL